MEQTPLPPLDVVVCTVPWTEDHETREGEQPTSQVYCRVWLNGVEFKRVLGVTVRSSGDFMEADVTIAPSSIRYEQITTAQLYDPDYKP